MEKNILKYSEKSGYRESLVDFLTNIYDKNGKLLIINVGLKVVENGRTYIWVTVVSVRM